MVANHNWKVLEKENKPAVMAPVFKGAQLERKKGTVLSEFIREYYHMTF